jgi:hypothetical protein
MSAEADRAKVIETRIHAFRNATQALVYTVIESSSSSAATSVATQKAESAGAGADANIASALAHACEQLLQLKLALCSAPDSVVIGDDGDDRRVELSDETSST